MFLNQFLRESRNKIICKLYEEETIFISTFNAENFMKIRKGMTSWECYENKWFYMKYIGKMTETESLLSTCCTLALIFVWFPTCQFYWLYHLFLLNNHLQLYLSFRTHTFTNSFQTFTEIFSLIHSSMSFNITDTVITVSFQ